MEDLRYPIGRFDPKAALPPGGRSQLIDSIEALPARLRQAVVTLTEAQQDTPYREGGWTVRQLAHHVPDSHMNAYVRMKWGLTEDAPLIKTYHEKAWAELPDARTAPVELSLDLLAAIHARWVLLLRSMSDSDYARSIRHPDLGAVDLTILLMLYEWHGRHHLAHVENLRNRMGW